MSTANAISEAFKFEGREVRVLGTPEEPWFVAKDVCDVLDISNSRDALSRLDEDEKDDVGIIDAIGRTQETSIINESGLYSLVLTSRKPEAKAFKKWITKEVIPSIRKTGSYSVERPKELTPAEQLLATIQSLQASVEITAQLERQLADQERRLRQLEEDKQKAKEALLALPPATAKAPEETLDMKIHRLVRHYCSFTREHHHVVWASLNQQFELRYRKRPTQARNSRGNVKESFLQACTRLGYIQDYYNMAYELLRPDEEGRYNFDFLKTKIAQRV